MSDSIVYGAWAQSVREEGKAVAAFDEEKFILVLEDALKRNNGDVRSALASIKEALAQKLRRSL